MVAEVVVAVLFTTGDQVPGKLLFDKVGSVNELPLQNGPNCVNVGVWFAVIVTVAVPLAELEQLPIETLVKA